MSVSSILPSLRSVYPEQRDSVLLKHSVNIRFSSDLKRAAKNLADGLRPEMVTVSHTIGFPSLIIPSENFAFVSKGVKSLNLTGPAIGQSSWIINNKGDYHLPSLLAYRFPQGAEVINLGSSTGEMAHGLALMLQSFAPGRIQDYPIHQIDFDPKVLLLAQKNLVSAIDHFMLHHHLPEAKQHYQPVFWNEAMRSVPRDVQDFYARNFRHVLLNSLERYRKLGEPFAKDFQQLTGQRVHAGMTLDEIKRLPLFQLKPELRKGFSYQTVDFRDWVRQDLRLKRPALILAMNFLYHLTEKDQLDAFRTLYPQLKPGSIVAISDNDMERGTDKVLKAAGFNRFKFKIPLDGEVLEPELYLFEKK